MRPVGSFMSVITAATRLPMPLPIATMRVARVTASSSRCMKAPSPVFTSRIRASIPSASFLPMIEATMRGSTGTVAVTSRRA